VIIKNHTREVLKDVKGEEGGGPLPGECWVIFKEESISQTKMVKRRIRKRKAPNEGEERVPLLYSEIQVRSQVLEL